MSGNAEQTVTTYDLKKDNYPNLRGESFRSVQIFECPVCGALTNLVMMGGYPNYGIRTGCPHSSEKWHRRLVELENQKSMPGWQFAKTEIEKEINAIRAEHEVENNLAGNYDMRQKSTVSYTVSTKLGNLL